MREGHDKPAAVVSDMKFEAGKIYTITVMGKTNGEEGLDVVMVEDQLLGSHPEERAG